MNSREEIERKVIELYHLDNDMTLGVSITPEREELSEGGYLREAQNKLMSNEYKHSLRIGIVELRAQIMDAEKALGEHIDLDAKTILTQLVNRVEALEARVRTQNVLDSYNCKRCAHKWQPRGKNLPKICPKCKSKLWNIHRV